MPKEYFVLQRDQLARALHHRGMEHPMRQTASPVAPQSGEGDAALVERARRGEGGAFEAIMRRYNRRLFRIAHGILKNAGEAEDAEIGRASCRERVCQYV